MNMAMVRNLILRLTQKCNLCKIWISSMGLLYHSQRAKNTSSNKEISRHLRTRSITTFIREVTTGPVQRHKYPIHVLISCYFYTGVMFDTTLLSAPRLLAVSFWFFEKRLISTTVIHHAWDTSSSYGTCRWMDGWTWNYKHFSRLCEKPPKILQSNFSHLPKISLPPPFKFSDRFLRAMF